METYQEHKDHNHHNHNIKSSQGSIKRKSFYKSPFTNAWVTLSVIVGTILFYLLTHHKTHVFDVLPYFLILAMILMHIGGHGGYSHGGKSHDR